MIDDYLQRVFDSFDAAARIARVENNKWRLIDTIYRYLEDLRRYDYQIVLEHILALVERYPELDYGGPGAFGSFVAQQPLQAYTPQLLASLQRQPTISVLGWLDRTMSSANTQSGTDSNPVTQAQFQAVLAVIIRDPRVDDACRSFAQLCLDWPR